jgi:hypothetical protein
MIELEVHEKPLLTYRTWRLAFDNEGPVVTSLIVVSHVWTPNQASSAACSRGISNCPLCGIYSFTNECDSLGFGLQYVGTPASEMFWQSPIPVVNFTTAIVSGKVWSWGTTVECEKGIRSQFAYPALFTGVHGDFTQIYNRISRIISSTVLITSEREKLVYDLNRRYNVKQELG